MVDAIAAIAARMRSSAVAQRDGIYSAAPDAIAAAAVQLQAKENADRVADAAAGAGIHPAMAAEGVALFSARLLPQNLRALREAQLQRLGNFIPPRIVFHVLAGNVFVSGLESVMLASLCGARSIVRCSSEDVQFPQLWKSALESNSALAETIAVGWWPAEWVQVTRAAARMADAVVGFGNDDSVTAVRNVTPVNARFVPHGSKLSFAVIGADALDQQTADRLAFDFSIYDQQGCLSPRAAFLLTEDMEAGAAFAQLLCSGMRELTRQLPRRALMLEESAALARARDEAILGQAIHNDVKLLSAATDDFLVTVRAASGFQAGCKDRNCDLRIAHRSELANTLSAYRSRIATLGVAGNVGTLPELQQELRITRICPVGQMQNPPLGWTHDGRLSLADLVDFCSGEV